MGKKLLAAIVAIYYELHSINAFMTTIGMEPGHIGHTPYYSMHKLKA